MELKQGDYITDIPDEVTFNRLVAIMQKYLIGTVPDAAEYVAPWERHSSKGTLVWDDDNSIYWIGVEPEDLGRGRAKRKVSIEDVLSLEEPEEEASKIPTKDIEKGDYFVVDDMACSMKVTEHKIYQSTSVSRANIHFIDDKGNEDYHSLMWFKKVEAPKFSVGEVVTLSDTGNCYSTHSKASTWGLNNYNFDSCPKVSTAYTITAVFYYEVKFIYALAGDDGKEYLSGNKYFNRVFNSAEDSVTDIEEKGTKTPETAAVKSVGADFTGVKLHTTDSTCTKDITENKPVPQPLTAIIENPQWQHYNEQTETYSIKQEENTMNKTNQILITVPTSALAVTTTVTMFGEVIDATDEAKLHSLITRINGEQDALKAINKTAKSSRITGQINKLGAARTKVVEMLDALPEEGADVS